MIAQAYLDLDVTDDYSRQSVSDCVILTGNVFDGRGILRNVGQKPLLVNRPGVNVLGKGKGELVHTTK